MPAKTREKTKGKKVAARKAPVKRRVKAAAMTAKAPEMPKAICASCHAFPVGSIELVSLLLVLVFSLTAVLLTSVYDGSLKNQQIQALKAEITEG